MLDSAIKGFLDDRKEAWLKKKVTSNSSDEEKNDLEQQAKEDFSLASWLPSAAKRAGQLFMVSHPGKFSHPSAKISSVIASSEAKADGLLRSGNVNAELDVFGNAAALDVHKFLSLKLADGESILTHLQNNTPEIETQLTIPTLPFQEIAEGLLAILDDGELESKTSAKVKQVYFPVDDNYHLLSLLSPSGIIFTMKERINAMHFSEISKEVREARRNNKAHDQSLSELYNLNVIGFGGTKPQNISVLNNNNGGKAYLLPSMPPNLKAINTFPPRQNFFIDSLWVKAFQDDFKAIHALLAHDPRNNMHIRNKRDYLTRNIIYQVVDQVWRIRSLEPGWSDLERNLQLHAYQKQWLDQQYAESRYESTEWLDDVKKEFSLWFLRTYEKINGTKEIMLGDDQQPYFKKIVTECEEAFR